MSEEVHRPHLCFMVPRLVRGGAQQQILLVGRELRRRGWPVTVVVMSPPEEMLEEFAHGGLPIEHLGLTPGRRGPLESARALVRAVRLLRRAQPAVLITFCYLANVLGKVAGRLAGVPVVIASIRNERFGSRLRERTERATEFLADLTTTNSRLAARSLVERGVVSKERLVVIPNAVALPFHRDPAPAAAAVRDGPRSPKADREATRAELGVAAEEFLWIAVGTLTEQKDYPTLWRAFAGLVGGGFPVRLAVAGEGDQRPPLEGLAEELGLGERVLFLGSRSDVSRLLAAADGYVLSSAWEGLPNSLMEAVAAGLPCVATGVGGVEEVLCSPASGRIVPPHSPKALERAMTEVVRADPSERRAGATKNRQQQLEAFSVGRVTDAWLELLPSSGAPAGSPRSRPSEATTPAQPDER